MLIPSRLLNIALGLLRTRLRESFHKRRPAATFGLLGELGCGPLGQDLMITAHPPNESIAVRSNSGESRRYFASFGRTDQGCNAPASRAPKPETGTDSGHAEAKQAPCAPRASLSSAISRHVKPGKRLPALSVLPVGVGSCGSTPKNQEDFAPFHDFRGYAGCWTPLTALTVIFKAGKTTN